MLKYVDFWYDLKTKKKHAQTISEGVSMETTKARAVLHNKIIIIMLQDSSVDWRYSYLSLFVARSIFNLSETIILVHDSVQHKKGLIWSYVD